MNMFNTFESIAEKLFKLQNDNRSIEFFKNSCGEYGTAIIKTNDAGLETSRRNIFSKKSLKDSAEKALDYLQP